MTTAEPLAKPVVLDCTLRDGGYYNAWDFDRPVVERYLAAASEAGVPVIEIGFRSMPQEQFLGAYAYSSDAVLEDLPLPAGAEIVVMVNASELLAHDGGPVAAVDMLFRSAEVSPVSRVRLAAHFDELAACGDIARRLKDLGYGVAVNLMQATGRSDDALAEAAAQVADWDAADVLYFADSLGTMTPDDTRRMVAALRRGWPGDLGIHTHDNRGQALANSLAAIDEGVAWVDSTVLGMGRGAGNTPTEYLLLELARRGDNRFRPDALFSVVAGDFAGLREQYRWGCNLFYYLSAMEGVHPLTCSRCWLTNAMDRRTSSPPSARWAKAMGDAIAVPACTAPWRAPTPRPTAPGPPTAGRAGGRCCCWQRRRALNATATPSRATCSGPARSWCA